MKLYKTQYKSCYFLRPILYKMGGSYVKIMAEGEKQTLAQQLTQDSKKISVVEGDLVIYMYVKVYDILQLFMRIMNQTKSYVGLNMKSVCNHSYKITLQIDKQCK